MVVEMIRSYTQLKRMITFDERFKYLKLKGFVGESTFGYDRYLNQYLYKSRRWTNARDSVIIRDSGCDLGIIGCEIFNKIIVHHMNPITIEDIELNRDEVFDMEFLICTSMDTHNAIHFGDESKLLKLPIERTKNDTCPWL
jgi:hypothetical protein